MYGEWLKARPQFEELFKDPQSATNRLINLVESNKFLPCLFIGSKNHWVNSIKYSFEGETGFTLWGSADISSPSAILDRYKKAYLRAEQKYYFPQLEKVLIGAFKANDGVLGFGVVTDVGFDATRNFVGWEEPDRYWVFRYRMKVFWLHESIRKNPSDPSKWQGENPQLKGVSPLGNNCFEETNQAAIESFKAFILSKKDEIRQTLEFYAGLTHRRAVPIQQQPVTAELECRSVNQIPTVSEDFFIDKGRVEVIANTMRKTNVILVGPPGVGKTRLAIEIARSLTGSEECFTIYTANALWFRRNLVGGESIRNGSVVWISGVLIKAYVKASRIKGDGYYFVILDEINRADVDKAFGELFTIFSSPDPESWSIPDSIADEIKSYEGNVDEYAREFVRIYESLKAQGKQNEPLRKIRLVTTMNLVDARNLFNIGDALARRFVTFYFDYPNGTEDLDLFLTKYDLSDEEKNGIKDLVAHIRRELKNDRDSLVKFNLSPAAVRSALEIYSMLRKEDRNVEKFADMLLSTLGTLDQERVEKVRKIISDWKDSRTSKMT
ncbi:MAG: AAA family ATPase [Thermoprotei archaeon]